MAHIKFEANQSVNFRGDSAFEQKVYDYDDDDCNTDRQLNNWGKHNLCKLLWVKNH